jgi:transcription factor SPN1
MEDLEDPQGVPVTGAVNEPQANSDPQDPLRPEIDEEDNARTPPLADPTADMEGREDNGDPALGDEADGQQAADDDDLDSELEELDEEEFANFDASALNISTQPMQVDESNVALLGVHKRKRTAEEEAERERKKKKKEKRREKPTRSSKKAGGNDDDFDGGEDADGKRARRSRLGPDGRPAKAARRQKTPENEENLTPEERKLWFQ